MKQLKIFIELTRLDRPIGYMLLFWPCSWGLALSNSSYPNNELYINFLILFFLGSVLMRSAGCIFNDIVDKDFDKKVKRTKKRPIPSGRISVNLSLIYVVLLCALAFVILIQFNKLTIFLGLGSMFLAFAYPFMKRITFWPQLFLGITFNWGIVMAWTAMGNEISLNIILLYISAIFWTLGYDTIYGAQDMSDDEIIGLKSTAIKFKNKMKLFIGTCYFSNIFLLVMILNKNLGFNIFTYLFFLFFLSLAYQLVIFNKKKPSNCLSAFKSNNLSGLILFLGINFI